MVPDKTRNNREIGVDGVLNFNCLRAKGAKEEEDKEDEEAGGRHNQRTRTRRTRRTRRPTRRRTKKTNKLKEDMVSIGQKKYSAHGQKINNVLSSDLF